MRRCSRSGCLRPVTSTLTYVYADSTVVLGPLAAYAEPHSYDLCEEHSHKLTVPQGWDVVRVAGTGERAAPRDELVALADALADGQRDDDPVMPRQRRRPPEQPSTESGVVEVSRRGHLRVLRAGEDTVTT